MGIIKKSFQRLHHFPARDKRTRSQMMQRIQLIPVKLPASGDKCAFIRRGGNHFAKQSVIFLCRRGDR